MNLIVAVPLDPSLAALIGKKGSENSITFYNRKSGEDSIVALAPTSVAEKFYALPEAMLVADQILVSTAVVDGLLGEVIIACGVLGKRVLLTRDNDVSALVREAGLQDHKVVGRQHVLEELEGFVPPPGAAGDARVDIDKAFNVKGIGTIALGVVKGGSVHVHDELIHSSGAKVAIRSIQVQDRDVTETGYGARVGLALKGMEADDIEKGDILAARRVARSANTEVSIRPSRFAKEALTVGGTYELVHNFSRSFVTVKEVDGDRAVLSLEKPAPLDDGSTALLVRMEVPRIFAACTVKRAW